MNSLRSWCSVAVIGLLGCAGPAEVLDSGVDAAISQADAGTDAGLPATDGGTDAGLAAADGGPDAGAPSPGAHLAGSPGLHSNYNFPSALHALPGAGAMATTSNSLVKLDADGQPNAAFAYTSAVGMFAVDATGRTTFARDQAYAISICRLLESGAADLAFGTNGCTGVAGLPSHRLMGVKRAADGSVVALINETCTTSCNKVEDNALLIRLLPSGAVDTAFGTNGVLRPVTLSNDATAEGFALQNNGDIVLFVRASSASRGLMRVKASGAADATFGLVATAGGVLLAQPDDRILALGTVDGDDRVRRFSSNGSVDATYGQAGAAVLPAMFGSTSFDFQPVAFALDPLGRLYVTAEVTAGTVTRAAVKRIKADGALDPLFVAGLHPTSHEAGAVAISPTAIWVGFAWMDGNQAKSGIALLQP